MDAPMWMKIATALVMAFMLWRIYPAARHYMQNGPKGNASQWLTVSMLLGGVVLFVALMILMVQG